MISFSYTLSKKEGKIATPEIPLSDLGNLVIYIIFIGFASYFSYWTETLVNILLETKENNISIKKLAEMTSIREVDISQVLEELKIIRYHDGNYIIVCDENILTELAKKSGGKKGGIEVIPDKLIWVPYKLKYD